MDKHQLLSALGIDKQFGHKYIEEALDIILELKLKPSELVLDKHIVPVLAKKYNVTECSIQTAMCRAITLSYRKLESVEVYNDYFGSRKRLPLKKFLLCASSLITQPKKVRKTVKNKSKKK